MLNSIVGEDSRVKKKQLALQVPLFDHVEVRGVRVDIFEKTINRSFHGANHVPPNGWLIFREESVYL